MLTAFFVLWITLCGQISLEIVLFGMVISGVVFWFTCHFFHWSLRKERKLFKLLIPALGYVALLVKEIIKANIAMLKIVLSPRLKEQVQPVLIRVKVPLETNIAKMTLANSITLTPGTITVENRETEYIVHAINRDFAQDVDCSAMVEALERLEKLALEEVQA